MANALILGSDGAVGGYLARLLNARGQTVIGVGDDDAVLRDLGIADDVTPVDGAEAGRLAADGSVAALYAINDGSAARAALVAETLDMAAAAARPPRAVHVVDASLLRTSPVLHAMAARVAGWRRDDGLGFANAVLHAHDSRLGPAGSLPALVTTAAWGAAQGGGDRQPLEIAETGPLDWGWTPEYVDAIIRIAAAPQAADLAIGSGHLLSVADIVTHAFAYFRQDPAGHVRIIVGVEAPEPAVDTARLKLATGWSASTWGRDLVRAWCEGAAARAGA